MNDNKFLSKLSHNLLEILDDDEYYDINIEVGNDPYVKIFHAHVVILNYRSPYLRRILSTIKNKTNWIEQNFNMIYQTSFESNSFLELQKFCTELISKEPGKIFKSSDFNSISEKSLISLIRHDNLQMSEAQVWKYVLKWGLA